MQLRHYFRYSNIHMVKLFNNLFEILLYVPYFVSYRQITKSSARLSIFTWFPLPRPNICSFHFISHFKICIGVFCFTKYYSVHSFTLVSLYRKLFMFYGFLCREIDCSADNADVWLVDRFLCRESGVLIGCTYLWF